MVLLKRWDLFFRTTSDSDFYVILVRRMELFFYDDQQSNVQMFLTLTVHIRWCIFSFSDSHRCSSLTCHIGHIC